MSVPLDDVVRFLDERLRVSAFDEAESNGLIVRANDAVTRVAAAVNTSFHAIAEARKAGADLLVVHHRSWPEIDLELVEEKRDRLLANRMSQYCAHSALDAAPDISNGDGLARAIGVTVRERFLEYHGGLAAVIGTADGTFAGLVDRLRGVLGVPVEAWQNTESFGTVAIATGGAFYTTMVEEARRRGADTYITGEATMYTKLYARERGVNLVAGTHWATETFGVKSLGDLIEERFGLPCVFIVEQDGIR